MHDAVLNECLSEIPEIGLAERLRNNTPHPGSFRWTGEAAVDGGPANVVGLICVSRDGSQYVVRSVPGAVRVRGRCASGHARIGETEICRVVRPNNTVQFREMKRCADVAPEIRQALIAFVTGPAACSTHGISCRVG